MAANSAAFAADVVRHQEVFTFSRRYKKLQALTVLIHRLNCSSDGSIIVVPCQLSQQRLVSCS